jgi:hypothetical protein
MKTPAVASTHVPRGTTNAVSVLVGGRRLRRRKRFRQAAAATLRARILRRCAGAQAGAAAAAAAVFLAVALTHMVGPPLGAASDRLAARLQHCRRRAARTSPSTRPRSALGSSCWVRCTTASTHGTTSCLRCQGGAGEPPGCYSGAQSSRTHRARPIHSYSLPSPGSCTRGQQLLPVAEYFENIVSTPLAPSMPAHVAWSAAVFTPRFANAFVHSQARGGAAASAWHNSGAAG